ncbi:MAG: cadmium-translocating P-type ATPase [Anaerolineae bacterium]|nr:cadmium-translocating P-type ATPase [Anaerolineae bacterium]
MATLVDIREPKDTPRRERPHWLTQAWLEPRFVVVTLAAILLSIVADNAGAPEIVIALLGVTAFVTGGTFGLLGALESLRHRRLDVDMLMILAALGAAIVGEWRDGALLLFLFSLSNVLQDYAIGRSRQAIRGLLKLYPSDAKVRRGADVQAIKIEAIRVGDIVLIQPGERIPVDGIVRDGRSAVDQAPITGESMPVEKLPGDRVFAGTLNGQGALDVEALQPASDTVLARIIKMVEEAQDSKAPTERFLETFEQYYATLIIAGVILFIIIPPALGLTDFASNFYRAMVLMTVASPCALVISTPAAFISAIASAARSGVLFKGGAYLEALAGIKAVAFDKTGTLTQGKPVVTEVLSCCELCDDELLSVAAAVESRSEHPLATAILNAAHERQLPIPAVTEFAALPGRGIESKVDEREVHLGSIAYLEQQNPMPEHLVDKYMALEAEGKTVVGVVRQGQCEGCGACEGRELNTDWMGIIAVADAIRPEAKAIVEQLHGMGITVAMLTGDNERVARNIAGQLGIDRVHASLMPEDKVTAVRQIESEVGAVAMVGDGVNDAPALATAAIGIAMGAAGTDVAMETADLVLMGDRLELIPFAINLSKKARRVVWQNLTFAIGVIVVLILSAFIINLPLPLGVLGHEGSTVIVVMNGLIALLLIPEIQRRRAKKQA